MAVHAVSGTLVASTVASNTLTSWQPYVIVTFTSSGTAAPAYVTVDGTTPTVGGADETYVSVPASGAVTVALKNLSPKPDLSTTTPLATDPSAVPAFTAAQTVVKIISAQTHAYSVELSPSAGALHVLA
jgi:hypothetical protein